MKQFAVLAALLILGGCNLGQQIARHDDGVCRSYGLQFGTGDYAQCRQNLVAQRQAQSNFQQQQNQQNLENLSRALNAPRQPVTMAPTYYTQQPVIPRPSPYANPYGLQPIGDTHCNQFLLGCQ